MNFGTLQIGSIFERFDSKRNLQQGIKISDTQCFEVYTYKIKEIKEDYPVTFLADRIRLEN